MGEDSPSFLPRINIPGRIQTFPVLRENQLYLIVRWILLEGGTYRHEHWLVYRKIRVRTTAAGMDQLRTSHERYGVLMRAFQLFDEQFRLLGMDVWTDDSRNHSDEIVN